MNSHKQTVTGIVVEYNPFHNGHIYHIEHARKVTGCDVLIAIMSPNYVQRGEPAFIDKWERTRFALMYGVDLVLELPTHIALQSAAQFASNAVALLAKAGITDLVYGSEILSVPELTPLDHSLYKQGYSYAKSKNSDEKEPNTILGAYYEKSAEKYHIQTHRILRTNRYHEIQINTTIASATAIRNAVVHEKEISLTTPMPLNIDTIFTLETYYPFIRYEIIKEAAQIKTRFLIREGLENKLYKEALIHDTYHGFIHACTSKRYTASRIRRSLMHIYLHTPTHMETPKIIRVLGMNSRGRDYLKKYKNNAVFATLFKETQYKDFEEHATLLYALPYKNRMHELHRQEKSGPIIIP